jgi:hypothetical protein
MLWAVLQFALPGFALLADAQLERDAQDAPRAHVESGTSKGCRPVHPDECALCQVLLRVAPPSEATPLPDIASVVRPPEAVPASSRASGEFALATLPRAPPVAA